MNFWAYFFLSILSVLITVYYSYYTYKEFYPIILFLVSSKVSFIIVGNMIFALSLLFAKVFKVIFFGTLRSAEVELLIEKAKYTIPETCLALTIFRNELTTVVLLLFASVIYVKLFHRLTKFRLEYLEQIMPISIFAQLQVLSLLTFLIVVDIVGTISAIHYVKANGKSVIMLFAFEFGLLFIYAVNLTSRFIIQLVDSMYESGLTSKGLYLMITDLICEIVKFLTYFCFFYLIFSQYGLPIHILRDVWGAFNSCQRKFLSFVQYLRLTRNLDARFENATAEELQNAGSCLVCRESMDQGKKLPCGHVFHMDCLRMWLQHQQTCPLCRADIPVTNTNAATPTVDPNDPNDANAAAAAIIEPQLPAAPGNSNGSSNGHIAMSLLASMQLNQVDFASLSFPRFCVVLVDPYIVVRADPMNSSSEVRTIKSGTIVFISSRVVGSDGWGWLKTPDGWVLEVLLDESIGSVASDPSRVTYAIVPVNSLSPPVKRDSIIVSNNNNSSARHHPFDDDCVQHNKVRIDVDDFIQSTDRYARETDDRAMTALLTQKRSDSSSFTALRNDRSRQDYAKRMADVYERKLGRTEIRSPVMKVGDRIVDHLDADAAVKEGATDDVERLLLDTDMDTADIESRISDLLQLLRLHYSAKRNTGDTDTAWGKSYIGEDDSTALLKSGITQYLNSSKVRRLEHMMLVQEQVQNITVNLAELSRSVLLCQQSLSKIIKDEIDSLDGKVSLAKE